MKEIPLTKNKVAIVDDEVYDFLMQWKWHHGQGYGKRGTFIGKRSNKTFKQSIILLHRQVYEYYMGEITEGLFIDHINQNKLDNRISNLRLATYSQNSVNTVKYRNNNSGYKGVCWHKSANKWWAYISYQKKKYSLGLFITPEDAARAYNTKAQELFGEYAYLNDMAD